MWSRSAGVFCSPRTLGRRRCKSAFSFFCLYLAPLSFFISLYFTACLFCSTPHLKLNLSFPLFVDHLYLSPSPFSCLSLTLFFLVNYYCIDFYVSCQWEGNEKKCFRAQMFRHTISWMYSACRRQALWQMADVFIFFMEVKLSNPP